MAQFQRELVMAAAVAVFSGAMFGLLFGWMTRRSGMRRADPVDSALAAEMGGWFHVWSGVGFGLLMGGMALIQNLIDSNILTWQIGWLLIAILLLVGIADVPFIRSYRSCLRKALKKNSVGSQVGPLQY
jgi:hypothetical protein